MATLGYITDGLYYITRPQGSEYDIGAYEYRKVGVHMEVITIQDSISRERAKSGNFDAQLQGIYLFYFKGYMGKIYGPEFSRLLKIASFIPTISEFEKAIRKPWHKIIFYLNILKDL